MKDMNNRPIGYIICESGIVDIPKTEIIREDTIDTVSPEGEPIKKRRVVAQTILQTADVINRNRRIYPKEELFPQLESERIKQLLAHKQMFGEDGHPLDTALTRQQTIDPKLRSVSYQRFWTEGNYVWGEYKGANTEYGEALDLDLREGAIPEFSLRALGSVESTNRGAVVSNLKMITYDRVIFQSDYEAYTRKIVSENADILIPKKDIIREDGNGTADVFAPIMNDDIKKYIIEESANFNVIKESFDIFYDTIKLDEDGHHVVMTTKEGDIMIVNLEQYIHNEIINHVAKNY